MTGKKSQQSRTFASYGVVFRIEARDERLLEKAHRIAERSLVGDLQASDGRPEHVFTFGREASRGFFLDHNGQEAARGDVIKGVMKYFDSLIRVTIGEDAKRRVFIHAGVVGWQGKAIVIPGDSFTGKSTLTLELVKNGADYYSDEFAIADGQGRIHPFARPINMRTDDGAYMPYEVKTKGAECKSPLPVGMVLLTEYKKAAKFRPKLLTAGEGVLGLIPQTLSIRKRPEFSIKVLNLITNDALIVMSKRNHAPDCVDDILKLL